MKDYARLKCQELLEIVAEKAKIIDEDNDVYEQPHIFYCNGGNIKLGLIKVQFLILLIWVVLLFNFSAKNKK